ncbi:MAG: hypothetical protein ABF289_05895 [Clostridiales bacterium]
MAKKIVSILITFIIVLSITTFIYAEDVELDIPIENYDPISEVMPELDYIYDKEYNSNEHITTYRENYSLDIEAGSIDFEKGINYIADILFYVQRALVEAIVYIFDQAFTFSVYEIFKGILNTFIVNMFTTTFGLVSSILLALIGFYFFITNIQRKSADFWAALLQTVIVIAIAFLYFNKPLMLIEQVDNAVNNLSTTILSTRPDITGDKPSDYYSDKLDAKDTGVITVANSLWEQYIHKPWRVMEFADSEIADKYEDEMLSYSPGNPQREELLQEIEENTGLRTKDLAIKRLGLIIMYLIPMVINLLLMGALCVLAIGYQFMIMLIFVVGIFVFMLALIPSIGGRIVKGWIIKLLGTAGMKILISFILVIMISFNEALYKFGNDSGWMAALIIQLAIYIVIYIKRASVMEVFMIAKDALQNPGGAYKRLSGMKKMEAPYLKNTTVGMKSVLGKITSSYKGTKDFATVKANDFREKSNKVKEIKNASQYLDKKYSWHKGYADKKASEKGTEPVYNNFVKKIMEREKNNQKRYTDTELLNVNKRFSSVKNLSKERSERDNNLKGSFITGKIGKNSSKGIEALGYRKKGTSHIVERNDSSHSKPLYDPTRRNNKE